MHAIDSPEEKISVTKMNSELQQAQLELLSAHCATHKLRLNYSTEQLARHGRRDVLRRTIETASALNEYFSSVERQIPPEDSSATPTSPLNNDQMQRAVESVSSYLRTQRDHYLPVAGSISAEHRAVMAPYFSANLLDRIRIVELRGERVANPPFYPDARAQGFINLPDFTHMNSLTFIDVIVFNDTLTERSLFHGLVHAVQFQVLGLERYTQLFVRSFLGTRLHFLVPLEAHVFFLESKFARPAGEKFSVEEQVGVWAKESRY